MPAPRTFRVRNKKVTVQFVEDLRDDEGTALYGRAWPKDMRIEIRKGDSARQQLSTLIHEFAHIYSDNWDGEWSEARVLKFEHAMMSLITSRLFYDMFMEAKRRSSGSRSG